MRFAAAVVFAGVALAAQQGGGDYTTVTDVETITSCGPEVTNCPARQHSSPVTTSTQAYSGWGNNNTGPQPTAPSKPVKSYPTGVWGDCECDDEDTCTSASNTWATGGWSSQPTGSGSAYGNGNGNYGGSNGNGNGNYGGSSSNYGSSGNGSVSTSSPTGIVTAGASVAAPALLAIAAGLVAFLV